MATEWDGPIAKQLLVLGAALVSRQVFDRIKPADFSDGTLAAIVQEMKDRVDGTPLHRLNDFLQKIGAPSLDGRYIDGLAQQLRKDVVTHRADRAVENARTKLRTCMPHERSNVLKELRRDLEQLDELEGHKDAT